MQLPLNGVKYKDQNTLWLSIIHLSNTRFNIQKWVVVIHNIKKLFKNIIISIQVEISCEKGKSLFGVLEREGNSQCDKGHLWKKY